jgi:hypothetical protein
VCAPMQSVQRGRTSSLAAATRVRTETKHNFLSVKTCDITTPCKRGYYPFTIETELLLLHNRSTQSHVKVWRRVHLELCVRLNAGVVDECVEQLPAHETCSDLAAAEDVEERFQQRQRRHAGVRLQNNCSSINTATPLNNCTEI